MIQGGNGRYHGNSRRETSLLETRQSGRKSERGEVASASADRFGSRALEEERRCASRPFLSSSLSLVVSPYASYQNRHFQLFSIYSTYSTYLSMCGRRSASTQPVVFTRCGLSACIPRPPRVHLITLQLGHAAARCQQRNRPLFSCPANSNHLATTAAHLDIY
jgi:hypothetical protein